MIDTTKLAPVGRMFLAAALERWPDFMRYATVDDSGSLVIEYPSPARADAAPLWISADADFDEIVIGFGGGHSHGGPWNLPDAADFEFESSLRFIDDIFDEVVVGYTLRSGHAGIGRLEHVRATPYSADVRSVRSWRGTHDR